MSKKDVMKPSWARRRAGQGYSYGVVIREVRRRARENSDMALTHAVAHVNLRFKLSALLSDFMRSEGIRGGEKELLRILGCVEEDHADVLLQCMLNPFPKFRGESVRTSSEIDEAIEGNKKENF